MKTLLTLACLSVALPALAQAPAPADPARWDWMFESRPARVRWGPNEFLMQVAASLPPGDAVDIGMGSGRNALFLAREGWKVIGVDTSGVGVSIARERAAADNLTLAAEQLDMFEFDYGTARFDLVLFMYMGPVGDLGPRIVNALKPGGHLVIEHFAGGFEAGSLPRLFAGLEVLRYSEDEAFPDYDQQTKGRVVRFLARKPK